MKSRQQNNWHGQQEEEEHKDNHENEEEEWERVIQHKIDVLVAARLRACRGHKEVTVRPRIERNVRFWVSSAREKGCDDPHHDSQGCPGPFHPHSFFNHTEFAHYQHHSTRVTGRREYIHTMCLSTNEVTFREFFKTGRVKWRVCHKVETKEETGKHISPCRM